jgi:flagellar basal body-associated protein FliL
MSLWAKIKAAAIAAAGTVVAVMYVLLQSRTHQRDQAESDAEIARRSERAHERKAEQSQRTQQAQAEARQEAVQEDEKIQTNKQRGDRSRGLNNDRLRNGTN